MPELFEPFVFALASKPESDSLPTRGTIISGTKDKEIMQGKPESDSGLMDGVQMLRGVCVGYVTREKNRVKQFFTRRAIITGGVCLAEDAGNEEVKELLMAVRERLNSKTIYIEMRNFEDYSKWKEAFEAAGFEYKKHLNFHVDPAITQLSENRKRQVRKSDAISELAISELEVKEWYGILEQLYRTKVRMPLWPEKFFLEAYRQGVGKFMLVKHEEKVIGGSMIVALTSERMNELTNERKGCVYEWFECGLNSEYKDQYPSVMATYAGIQWAKEHGCARYDMMGAGEPGVPYGVRDFKAEFGGKLVEHGRFLCVTKPLLYKIGAWGVKLLRGRI